MPTKPDRKKPEHRPMPEDPRLLAQAMFDAADRKIKEKGAAKKAAPESPGSQGRSVPARRRAV